MRILAILPPFLPIDTIRNNVESILPGVDIRTDADFSRDDCEVLIITTFTASSSPSKQSPSGISGVELYGIIGAAVAVIIVGSAVFMIRKKK